MTHFQEMRSRDYVFSQQLALWCDPYFLSFSFSLFFSILFSLILFFLRSRDGRSSARGTLSPTSHLPLSPHSFQQPASHSHLLTMPSSAPGRGSQSQSSVASWRLTQVFGGDKAPDEEIPEGLPGIRRFPSHSTTFACACRAAVSHPPHSPARCARNVSQRTL